MTSRTGPLAGIRVLDLTHVMSGPYATAMMADLGAEVLKVEPPGRGDLSRAFAPHVEGESAYFLMLNRGKHSLTIDMKQEDGRRVVLDLASKVDVVVENFRPGVADRLGVGYDQVRTVNPSVIYASISGFGGEGPLSDAPAFDLVVQAMSGLMSVTGSPDGPATAVGESYADVLTGMFCAFAIMSPSKAVVAWFARSARSSARSAASSRDSTSPGSTGGSVGGLWASGSGSGSRSGSGSGSGSGSEARSPSGSDTDSSRKEVSARGRLPARSVTAAGSTSSALAWLSVARSVASTASGGA